MRDLLVVAPSRARPQSAARLRDAMRDTCQGDTTLMVGADADDPNLGAYFRVMAGDRENLMRAEPGLRGCVAWFNKLGVPAAQEYRFIGALGDDFLPQTPGWDLRIMEALGQTPFAYGNELYPGREQGESLCHVFCRSEVVRALGYLGPPSLRHMFVDNIWAEWGKAAGITYLDDVILEHLHFTANKSSLDDTYSAAADCWPQDEAAFHAYMQDPEGLAADVAKLRGLT